MIEIDVQNVVGGTEVPGADDFRCWAEAAIQCAPAELVIRVVGRPESAELNERYRGKAGPTNVLSFPFQAPPGMACDVLGDIVICAPLVADEARAQGKPARAHWAHLTVHGVLHLQGFDHVKPSEAEIMEAQEVAILARLGFPDPYAEDPAP